MIEDIRIVLVEPEQMHVPASGLLWHKNGHPEKNVVIQAYDGHVWFPIKIIEDDDEKTHQKVLRSV